MIVFEACLILGCCRSVLKWEDGTLRCPPNASWEGSRLIRRSVGGITSSPNRLYAESLGSSGIGLTGREPGALFLRLCWRVCLTSSMPTPLPPAGATSKDSKTELDLDPIDGPTLALWDSSSTPRAAALPTSFPADLSRSNVRSLVSNLDFGGETLRLIVIVSGMDPALSNSVQGRRLLALDVTADLERSFRANSNSASALRRPAAGGSCSPVFG
mmetsp:Transcript_38483/g.92148  ORF Transcript_38483/g.92148 Transcript_38483/m.92148 type:complete len:215 (+) Transcript_38483:481-1125(+)